MARIRSIKPEFWTDEKIVELSAYARLMFIGLWNFCDDSGRMTYSPKRIKMQIFPADPIDCSELLGEIRGASLIDVYVIDGVEYLAIKGFDKHQKIDKRTASKLPPPPNSPEFPRIPPTEGKGVEGKGKEGNGGDNPPDGGAPKKSKSRKQPLPADFAISDRVRKWATEKGYTRLEERFEHFVGKAKANGYTYADWDEGFMGAIRDDWAKLPNTPKVVDYRRQAL